MVQATIQACIATNVIGERSEPRFVLTFIFSNFFVSSLMKERVSLRNVRFLIQIKLIT